MKNQSTVDLKKLNTEASKSTAILRSVLELILLIGTGGFLITLLDFKITSFGLNGKVFLNKIGNMVGEKFGVITSQYKLTSNGSMDVIFLILILLLILTLHVLISSERLLPLFIVGISILVLQGVFGNNKSTIWMTIVLFANMAIYLNKTIGKATIRWKAQIIVVGTVLIIGVLINPISNILWNDNGGKANSIKKVNSILTEQIDNFRYNRKNNIALKVKMSKPEVYYLKGFVAGDFTDKGWESTDKKTLYKYSNLFYWLHKDSFYGQSQLANGKQELLGEKSENKMTVSVVGASSKYIYTPYEYITDNEKLKNKNRIGDESLESKGVYGKKNYTFIVSENIVNNFSEMVDKLNRLQTKTDYMVKENYYNQFVYENYLKLTNTEKQLLSTYLKNNTERKSYGDAKSAIVNFLNKNIAYDEKSEGIKDYRSFLTEFLEKNKTGNNKDFATATVLMFRYFGIPSRYVKGYLITKKDIENVKANQTINIKQSNYHSWAEYYQDGIGWIPFETNSKYRDLMGTNDSISGNNNDSNSGDKQTIQNVNKDKHLDDEVEEKKVKDNKEEKLIYSIVALLNLLILFVVAYEIRLYILRRKIRQSFENGDNNRTVINYVSFMVSTLRIFAKVQYNNISEYKKTVAKYQSGGKNTYLEIVNLYEKARYSNKETDVNEANKVKAYVNNVRFNMYAGLKPVQKFRWKFVSKYGSFTNRR
ncbi:MAG: transglutaminase-like domain-containing protein [Eubacterium sp.]